MALPRGMRPLNDYQLFGGNMTAIQTGGNQSPVAVAAERGKIVGVAINVHTVIDAETTFDILVNGADSGVDATLPNATADESGVVMALDGNLDIEEGDALILQSNGEQVAATTADVSWIIRR